MAINMLLVLFCHAKASEQLPAYLPRSYIRFEFWFRNRGRLGYWSGSAILPVRAIHNCGSTRQRILQEDKLQEQGHKHVRQKRAQANYDAHIVCLYLLAKL